MSFLFRFYATSILEALSFMHGHNIVHRDLRDTSLFLETTGHIKVSDFSIDKRVRELLPAGGIGVVTDRFPLAIGQALFLCNICVVF